MPAAGGIRGFEPDYGPGPVLSLFFVPALVFAAAVAVYLLVILGGFLFGIRDIVGPLFSLLVLALAHDFASPAFLFGICSFMRIYASLSISLVIYFAAGRQ
jgi:hypothetical protein